MINDIRILHKPYYSKSRALVIGINKYKNASGLAYAVNDAQAIRDILVEKIGFGPDDVIYLKDEEATSQNILASYSKFTGCEVENDERIVVFYAGHGHTIRGIRGEVGFLVPHDGDCGNPASLIPWSQFVQYSELIPAKHILFIMDACYGGTMLQRSALGGRSRFLRDMMLRRSRQVITAGKADETVADSGGPIANHSVFTGHLIQGLEGAAYSDGEILTANGLMAYVQNKVSTDKNSRQTPHYGYVDGDGDFILTGPGIHTIPKSDVVSHDVMVVVPPTNYIDSPNSLQEKLSYVKKLLANSSGAIELHDFCISELKSAISRIKDADFKVSAEYSKSELEKRIHGYDEAWSDLSTIMACISYWAKAGHFEIISKLSVRPADYIDSLGGISGWLALQWYPLLRGFYSAGIGAVASENYDALGHLFGTRIRDEKTQERELPLVYKIAKIDLEFRRLDTFKQIPNHERFYVPMSEYLYNVLQSGIDDAILIGKRYESAFDDFEVLYSLAAMDAIDKREQGLDWAPVGRFGYKRRSGLDSPLARIISLAKDAGASWKPLKTGLFSGNLERFLTVAESCSQHVSRLPWH